MLGSYRSKLNTQYSLASGWFSVLPTFLWLFRSESSIHRRTFCWSARRLPVTGTMSDKHWHNDLHCQLHTQSHIDTMIYIVNYTQSQSQASNKATSISSLMFYTTPTVCASLTSATNQPGTRIFKILSNLLELELNRCDFIINKYDTILALHNKT